MQSSRGARLNELPVAQMRKGKGKENQLPRRTVNGMLRPMHVPLMNTGGQRCSSWTTRMPTSALSTYRGR